MLYMRPLALVTRVPLVVMRVPPAMALPPVELRLLRVEDLEVRDVELRGGGVR